MTECTNRSTIRLAEHRQQDVDRLRDLGRMADRRRAIERIPSVEPELGVVGATDDHSPRRCGQPRTRRRELLVTRRAIAIA